MSQKLAAFICDIDGTAAKMDGRSPYDYSKVYSDKPNQPILTIIYALHKFGYNIVYVSGRPDEDRIRHDTERWLRRHSFPKGELIMRAGGDRRPDNVVKLELYHQKVAPKYDVAAVFDDRDRVVKMWREQGLTCLQVNYGDF